MAILIVSSLILSQRVRSPLSMLQSIAEMGSYKITDEYEVKMSPLSQIISSGGKTVQVDIYEDGNGGWVLEVVDEFNNSTVWDETFETDSAALTEAKKAILVEGVDSLIGSESGKGDCS